MGEFTELRFDLNNMVYSVMVDDDVVTVSLVQKQRDGETARVIDG